MFIKFPNKNKGFTLIELMVSISIFSVVMLISTGSILSVFSANKKSQSLRAVMDNLNFTMEAMTRTIRFGVNYHCDITKGSVDSPRDCPEGADSFSVLDTTSSVPKQVTYKLSGTRIARIVEELGGGIGDRPTGGREDLVTSPDVTIQKLKFFVFGSGNYSDDGDLYQPKVVMVVSGYAGGDKPESKSDFTLQTTVSQRTFDSQ